MPRSRSATSSRAARRPRRRRRPGRAAASPARSPRRSRPPRSRRSRAAAPRRPAASRPRSRRAGAALTAVPGNASAIVGGSAVAAARTAIEAARLVRARPGAPPRALREALVGAADPDPRLPARGAGAGALRRPAQAAAVTRAHDARAPLRSLSRDGRLRPHRAHQPGHVRRDAGALAHARPRHPRDARAGARRDPAGSAPRGRGRRRRRRGRRARVRSRSWPGRRTGASCSRTRSRSPPRHPGRPRSARSACSATATA